MFSIPVGGHDPRKSGEHFYHSRYSLPASNTPTSLELHVAIRSSNTFLVRVNDDLGSTLPILPDFVVNTATT